MAALIRWWAAVVAVVVIALAAAWVASCGRLVGLGGPVVPLARIHVQVNGDVGPLVPSWAAGRAPQLRVALVWGAQWQPEPFCIVTPASDAGDAVLKTGCPDSFGFVASRVGADAPVAADGTATFDLTSLPAADVMVGDVTARVAYAGVMVYDDRNGNGTLDLHEGDHHGEGEGRNGPGQEVPSADAGHSPEDDIVYGASFISMTLPDRRVAFREGGFNANIAFYPRAGCPDPPQGFSVLSTGGFSQADGFAAALKGQLPQEDPAACGAATPDSTVITIAVQPPEPIKQAACIPRDNGSTTQYRSPPTKSPDLAHLTWACVPLPHLPGDDGGTAASDVTQLVIAGPPSASCKSLSHIILKGCRDDPTCPAPGQNGGDGWDYSKTPPSWWPCPGSP